MLTHVSHISRISDCLERPDGVFTTPAPHDIDGTVFMVTPLR
ncbi:hypothetical protein [Xenorhabdus bovienii]|nr:hypothetical protein [Xenorhabdus bovienii]